MTQFKKSVIGDDQICAFSAIFKQPFPLPHICRINQIPTGTFVAQTAFQLVLFEVCSGTTMSHSLPRHDFYHDISFKPVPGWYKQNVLMHFCSKMIPQ
jgi:hypothetical protein